MGGRTQTQSTEHTRNARLILNRGRRGVVGCVCGGDRDAQLPKKCLWILDRDREISSSGASDAVSVHALAMFDSPAPTPRRPPGTYIHIYVEDAFNPWTPIVLAYCCCYASLHSLLSTAPRDCKRLRSAPRIMNTMESSIAG